MGAFVNQRIAITISAFEPGEAKKRDRTIKKVELVIDADGSRPGGFKSQEADIENQVVKALNEVFSSLARDREYN